MLKINPTNGNISILKGDTGGFIVTLRDKLTKAPINLTGYTVRFTVKKNQSDDDSLAVIRTVLAGVDIFNAVAGQIKILLSKTDTNLTSGTYYYDIQYSIGNEVDTYLKAKLLIEQDITTAS